ncbi:hypothetical protein [Ruminococcus sp.]|uniref:hypothetical protein n=1 Tax=Ruminococcus sp. TaxID=41978 RepID=UPI00388D3C3C
MMCRKSNALKKPLILCIIFICITFCSCKISDEKLVNQTIDEYIISLKDHDLSKTDSFLSDDIKFSNTLNEDALEALYYTINDSYLVSTEFMNSKDSNVVRVTVKYVIVYSDDYIPVGVRNIGKNEIIEIFTLEKIDDKYLITGITPPT